MQGAQAAEPRYKNAWLTRAGYVYVCGEGINVCLSAGCAARYFGSGLCGSINRILTTFGRCVRTYRPFFRLNLSANGVFDAGFTKIL